MGCGALSSAGALEVGGKGGPAPGHGLLRGPAPANLASDRPKGQQFPCGGVLGHCRQEHSGGERPRA